ncbi:rRNA processing protein [Blastocladiella emersonii ATCC 22665]|nr:rRNA processing protein [Blastocladiella emersonii ATCC 22665]
MVQSKKKQKKNADFSKVKLKVGKKKPESTSSVSLEVRSRQLVLRGQSVASDKTDVAKTKRNLTLKELLSHLKHHNTGVRRDAVRGIQEIVDEHPEELLLHLGAILDALIEKVIDDEPDVRAALLATLDHLLGLLDASLARPFVSTFVVFVKSAMNHISPGIAADAPKFLKMWIDRFGALLIPHTGELLANFAGMLGSGTSSDSLGVTSFNPDSTLSSSNARTRLFYSLVAFLELLHAERSASDSRAASTLPSAMDATATLWSSPVPVAQGLPFSLFGHQTAAVTAFDMHKNESVLAFAEAITPAVQAFWMEASVKVFDKARITASESLDVCFASVQLLASVFRFHQGPVPEAWGAKYRASTLRHFISAFPFGGSAQTDPALKLRLVTMNLYFTEILSRVSRDDMEPALAFFVKSFAPVTLKKGAGVVLLPEQFTDALPALDALIHSSPAVLSQLLPWATSLPATNPTRALATRFLCERMLDAPHPPSPNAARAFVQSLVRYVWELKATALETTAAIFHFLRVAVATRRCDAEAVAPLIARGLGVFFYIPAKAGVTATGSYGPFLALPIPTQMLALDLLYYLDASLAPAVVESLTHCLLAPIADTHVVAYALDVVQFKCAPNVYYGILRTLYLGMTQRTINSAADASDDLAAHVTQASAGLPAAATSNKRKATADDGSALDPVDAYVAARAQVQDALDERLARPAVAEEGEAEPMSPDAAWELVSDVEAAKLPLLPALALARWSLFHAPAQSGVSALVANVVARTERVIAASDAPQQHPACGPVQQLMSRAREAYEEWEAVVQAAREA